MKILLESTLTCPECGHKEQETMPTDACQWFYECKNCGTLLKQKQAIAVSSVLTEQSRVHRSKQAQVLAAHHD